jgi:peroxiredoxin
LYQVSVGEVQVSFVAGQDQSLRLVAGDGGKLRVTGGADQDLFEAYEKFRTESLARLVMPARKAANAALAADDLTAAEPHTSGEVTGAQAHRHELTDFTLARLRGSPALYAASLRWDGDYRLEDLAAAVREFSKREPSLEISRAMEARIALFRATAIGAIAPALTGAAPDGSPVTLASFRGRHVLVDFWASWCSPCRTENRHYGELLRRFGPAGFEILGVAMDDNVTAWKAATAKDKVTWPQLSDLRGWKSPFAAAYGVTNLPASFLLDPEGRIIAKDVRGQALDVLLAARLGGPAKR